MLPRACAVGGLLSRGERRSCFWWLPLLIAAIFCCCVYSPGARHDALVLAGFLSGPVQSAVAPVRAVIVAVTMVHASSELLHVLLRCWLLQVAAGSRLCTAAVLVSIHDR